MIPRPCLTAGDETGPATSGAGSFCLSICGNVSPPLSLCTSVHTFEENYEWDQKKADGNLAKHGIDFVDATAAFSDPNSLILRTIIRKKSGMQFSAWMLLGGLW